MPTLRFFACTRCETVYADAAAPARCARCDERAFEEVAVGASDAAYFAPTDAG